MVENGLRGVNSASMRRKNNIRNILTNRGKCEIINIVMMNTAKKIKLTSLITSRALTSTSRCSRRSAGITGNSSGLQSAGCGSPVVERDCQSQRGWFKSSFPDCLIYFLKSTSFGRLTAAEDGGINAALIIWEAVQTL